MKTNNDKKAFGHQTEGGWGRGGGRSQILAGGIFPPGVRRSDSRQQKVQGKLDTFQSEEEEERHSSYLPRGALRCVFQVWSKIRNPARVQFFHRLCRQCAERAFSFSPRSARQTFPTKKNNTYPGASFQPRSPSLPPSLTLLRCKKVSHRVENPRESLRVRLSL